MPVQIAEGDSQAEAGGDRPGFSEEAFAARYDRRRSSAAGGAATSRTAATGPAAGAGPPAPRSRNSYMRSRARRLSAGPPPGPKKIS
jgi:hypothetical protein